jgi:hypothetical protein
MENTILKNQMAGFGCKTPQDAQIQILFNAISCTLMQVMEGKKKEEQEEIEEKINAWQKDLKETFTT